MHSRTRMVPGSRLLAGAGSGLDAGGGGGSEGGGMLDMHSAVGGGPASIFSQAYHSELDPLQVGLMGFVRDF